MFLALLTSQALLKYPFKNTWNNSRSFSQHVHPLLQYHEQHGTSFARPMELNMENTLPTVAKISMAIFTQINQVIATVYRLVKPYPNFIGIVF